MRRYALSMAVVGAMLVATAPAAASSPVTHPDFYRLASDRHPRLVVGAPGVLGNDSDPDGDPLHVELLDGPTYGGTFHLRSDGSFAYEPLPDFTGVDSISYWAFDGHSLATIGHAYFTVVHRASARDDAYGALTGLERRVSAPGVLSNDVGAEHARLARAARHGTVSVGANGHFVYRSDPGFVGADNFRYEAVVQGEPSSSARVNLTVKATNRRPQAVADDLATQEDTPLELSAPGVLANDADPDGDPLTAEVVSEPSPGEFFDLSDDGSLEYWPPADYDSPVTFTYRVNDGIVWSKPVTSTIEINPVDDPPTAEDDSYSMFGADSLTVPAPGVLENDHDDVESDTLFAVAQVPPRKGTLDLHADGSFTYTRTPGKRGIDSFSYRVDDSGGAQGGLGNVTIYPHSG